MTRDEKKKFENQRILLEERPDFSGGISAKYVRSYNMVVGPEELLLALKTNEDTLFFRVNADVAINLGLNLLETANKKGWQEIEVAFDKSPEN